MMKRSISIKLGLLIALFIVPASVNAQGSSNRHEFFCNEQQERQAGVRDSFSKRVNSYEDAVQRQQTNQLDRRQRMDEELATTRAKADLSRSESYQAIKERQSNDELKQKADMLANEVDAAVAGRREAYDKARSQFLLTLDELLSARDTGVKSAAAAFSTSANAAMDTATSLCDGNASTLETRDTFIRQMREARLVYAEFLRSRMDFRQAVHDAKKIRDKAFDDAKTEFQQAMQAIHDKYAELDS